MNVHPFFGGAFFSGGFFAGLGLGGTGEDEAGGKRKRGPRGPRGPIFKPTGLPPLRAKKRRSDVEITPVVVEPEWPLPPTLQPAAETATTPVAQRSLAQIEREIGYLLRKQLRTHDEEIVLLLLMATAAAI